jgi:hypothetical protein
MRVCEQMFVQGNQAGDFSLGLAGDGERAKQVTSVMAAM